MNDDKNFVLQNRKLEKELTQKFEYQMKNVFKINPRPKDIDENDVSIFRNQSEHHTKCIMYALETLSNLQTTMRQTSYIFSCNTSDIKINRN